MQGLRQLQQNVREFRRRLMRQVRVLVVDDEEAICMLFRELLSAEGYHVDTVESTAKAREQLSSVHYDLVVVDKNLPNESGVELIKSLHEGDRNIRSVLITGYPSQDTISEALHSGATDYITKPFDDIDHLVNRLKLVIHSRLSSLQFGFVARELKVLLSQDGLDAKSKVQLGQAMLAAQRSLNARLQLLLVDAADVVSHFDSLGLAYESISIDELPDSTHNPLVYGVHLSSEAQLNTILQLRTRDPSCEVLALAGDTPLELSLDAVRYGASDYVRLREGTAILKRRAEMAAERAQRRQRNLSLVASLCLVARDRGVEDWESLLLGLLDVDRAYILEALGMKPLLEVPEAQATSTLDHELEDLTQNELRRSRRFAWQQDVWVVCDSQKVTEAFTLEAKSGDISQNGMFLKAAIPLGAVVLVQLPGRSQDERVDLALGRVVRRTGDEGVGVDFLRTTEQVQEIVEQLRAQVSASASA